MNVTVTKIQPMVTPITHAPAQKKKRRTAGYGRVSTGEEEQQSSYAAQVDYYTKYIQANPEWEFVRVYADEGISGTSTKKREQFNEMVESALAGKLDLIITNAVITKGQFSPARIQVSNAANNDYFTISIISSKVNSFTTPCSYSFTSNSPVNMFFEKI